MLSPLLSETKLMSESAGYGHNARKRDRNPECFWEKDARDARETAGFIVAS
jgi:hypothetical protein